MRNRSVLFYSIATVIVVATVAVIVLAGMIAFGTAASPPPRQPIGLDRSDLPPLAAFTARDGAQLGYRAYPGGDAHIAVLLHGSATESSVMNGIAKSLKAAGAAVYSLDLRGHGASGPRGDVSYIGQLDDDIDDFMREARARHSSASFTLIGFSAGGALTMRIAAGARAWLFDRYIALAPAIPYPAPFARPDGGWVAPYFPRIIGIYILNQLGIHWCDGLTAIEFAVAPGMDSMTRSYSYRLLMSFSDRDYLAAVHRTTRPLAILVGEKDEQFYADRYEPVLKPQKPDLVVEIVPGVDHRRMLVDATALAAVRRQFEAGIASQQ